MYYVLVSDNNFKLGPTFDIEFEFRTSETSGVLMSMTNLVGFPSISLELNNGKVIFSRDFGNGSPIFVEQTFASPYTICDNRWHRVQATYSKEGLTLKVDDFEQKYDFPVVDDHLLSFTSPLYIGGIPG